MRVAIGQMRSLDPETAEFALQLGVTSVQFNGPSIDSRGGFWSYETLSELQGRCADRGFTLEALENGPPEFMSDIINGGAERERQLDNYCKTVANMGRAGIPFLGHHFMAMGVWRTDMLAPVRGGAGATAFDLAVANRGNRLGPSPDAGLSAEQLWENYERFLRCVLPVAESAGVRLALHPDDPPLAVLGKTARIFSSVGGLKRGFELAASPAWGLDLCLGTVSEMVEGESAVYEAITTFGSVQAICYVHFRQVQGTVPCFKECFLGEGSYSGIEAMRLLVQGGFDGFILDDHVPTLSSDSAWGHRSHAYAIGYLQALIEAARSENQPETQ